MNKWFCPGEKKRTGKSECEWEGESGETRSQIWHKILKTTPGTYFHPPARPHNPTLQFHFVIPPLSLFSNSNPNQKDSIPLQF